MAATGIDILYIDSIKQQPGLAVAAATSTAADDSSAEDTFQIGTAVEDAEECCRQEFEASKVAHGLSQLGLSASGTHQVYQRLEITHTDLQDPQAITHCQHIQQLVLSGNCLTTLQPLSQLKHLTSLDVSNNRLTQVLDYHVQVEPQAGAAARPGSNASIASRKRSSNLRKADLSYNSVDHIGDLSQHSNLQELVLAGNRLQRVGKGLEPLTKLRKLDLCSNSIRSCEGLQGLCSLQELSLDGNRISSLQPLSGLSNLQVLSAAHNQITRLDGVEGLSSLRVLDLGGNQLRRVEALAACRGLSLMTSLNVAGNPVEAAQNVRLHMVHLLTQLQQLNGVEVTVVEKVDAGNMVGAATDGLVLIRRQFFPNGELEDGGGAVPPTAAGLKVSKGSEERSSTDPSSMFAAIDGWAQSVQPSLALQPLASPTGFAAVRTSSLPTRASNTGLLSARQSAGGGQAQGAQPAGSNTSSRRTSSAGRSSTGGSRPVSNEGARLSANLSAKQLPAQPGGAAAIAARLAAGCCPEAPYRQLQLLRACYCWVLTHVRLPRDCDMEAGVELVTWDVGRHVFGEGHKQALLQEVLLPGYTGTWAECVSQLLVNLLRACHMEAQQLSGFWKAGGLASVGPGEQLVTHNHSWVAAKVNGLWRLLDPVYAMIMAVRDQPLPFFLPPEAFIHTHLPFEPCWQLLSQPVRTEEWWARPELALGFAAAGGRLLDDGRLRACTVIELDREALVLPTVRIPIAAPANPQQHLRISLLDSNRQLLASWQHAGAPAQHNRMQQGSLQHASQHSINHALGANCRNTVCADGCCPVFQQQELGPVRQLAVQLGADTVQLVAQELWAALPGTGTFYVNVDQVTEVPGGLMPAVHVECLQQPLSLTLRQYQDVTQLKVVVKPAAEEEANGRSSSNGGAGSSHLYRPRVAACLPQLQPALSKTAGAVDLGAAVQLQLLSPEPGALLEADRTQLFAVLAPAWASVAVGSEQSGWVVLQRQQEQQLEAAASGSGANCSEEFCVFSGSVVLPRISACYVAVQDFAQQQGGSWLPVLGLHVRPPVQDLVPLLDEAHASSATGEVGSPGSPVQSNAAHLLSALDVDGDGVASRKDMLLAFRRDRQLADHLKMPAKIRAGDGTFDAFLTKYIVINRSGLGLVGLDELATYLASLTAATRSSSHGTCSRVATAARQPGSSSTSRGAVLTPKTPGTPATPLRKLGSGVRRSLKTKGGQ